MAELQQVVTFIRSQVLARTKLPESKLQNDTPLSEAGVDSLDVVLISGKIEDHFGVEINPGLMFEYRTINEVSKRVLELIEA